MNNLNREIGKALNTSFLECSDGISDLKVHRILAVGITTHKEYADFDIY
jgi:hypothetical protein